jgi:hypothetical protein
MDLAVWLRSLGLEQYEAAFRWLMIKSWSGDPPSGHGANTTKSARQRCSNPPIMLPSPLPSNA